MITQVIATTKSVDRRTHGYSENFTSEAFANTSPLLSKDNIFDSDNMSS